MSDSQRALSSVHLLKHDCRRFIFIVPSIPIVNVREIVGFDNLAFFDHPSWA